MSLFFYFIFVSLEFFARDFKLFYKIVIFSRFLYVRLINYRKQNLISIFYSLNKLFHTYKSYQLTLSLIIFAKKRSIKIQTKLNDTRSFP